MSRDNIILIALITLIVLFLFRKKIRFLLMGKTWDQKTDETLNDLHPKIRVRAFKFINDADKKHGIKLRAYSGLRTMSEQEELYSHGRTDAQPIVTWAKPGQSYHNFGLGFDVVEIKGSKALWSNPNWEKIGEMAEKLGLEWGGRWLGKKRDRPHIQDSFGKHHTDLLALYEAGDRKGEYVKLA